MKSQATRSDLIHAVSTLVDKAITRAELLTELAAIGIDVRDNNIQNDGKEKYTRLALGKLDDSEVRGISERALERFASNREESKEAHENLRSLIHNSEKTTLKLYFSGNKKPDIIVKDLTRGILETMNLNGNVYVEISSNDYLSWEVLANKLKSDFPDYSSLLKKMYGSIPTLSPQARKFFKVYLGMTVELKLLGLPALIPEFYLHYDPMTIKFRGGKALESQRCDFYMKMAEKEIIFEIDGIQHYANRDNTVNRSGYGKQCAWDRERLLRGYEIYRFGTAEFDGPDSEKMIEQFFRQLFAKFYIVM